MFDFFRDMISEINGIDTSISKEQMRKKQAEKYILSTKAKVIIGIAGIIYIIQAITNMSIIGMNGSVQVFKYILLCILVIGIFICFFIKKKIAEIIALSGIALFITLNFLLT